MSETTMTKQEFDGLSVSVERAVPGDAEAIMTIKREAWLAAYPNKEFGVTVEDIQKKFPQDSMPAAIENWQRGIASEKENGDRVTFVARVDGKVVGFTAPCSEDGQRRIGAMYISPDAQGKGVGSQLLRKAVQWHGLEQDIYLHVVRYNHNAIRFYEHFGFRKTGKEMPEEFDEQQSIRLLPEIEMALKAD